MIGALVAGITGSGGASLSSYESIATATGTGSSGTITFSSIPSTFKHLQIRGMSRTSYSSTNFLDNYIVLNSDTGTTNYAYHYLNGNGTSVTASGTAGTDQIYATTSATLNQTSGIMGVSVIDILDYASTTKNKTIRILTGGDANGSGRLRIASGLWMNTAAITSISIYASLGNWNTDTTFALYGIKEA